MKAKKKYILLKDHGVKRVELHDIVYCEARLDNGKTIYLPRGAYRGLREQYFDYYYSEEEGESWTP